MNSFLEKTQQKPSALTAPCLKPTSLDEPPKQSRKTAQMASRSSVSTRPLGFFIDSFSPPCTSSTTLPKLSYLTSYLLTHWLWCSGFTWRHKVSCTPVLHQCFVRASVRPSESCFPQSIPLSCFNKSLRGNRHKASVTSASLPLRMMHQTRGSKPGFCDSSTGDQRNAGKCSRDLLSPRWG